LSKRNENRPGYKETRVGWIPEDWEVKWLKDIATINELSLSENTLPDFSFYYLSLSDVNENRFSIPDGKITFVNAPSRARRKFKPNDVLLSTVRPNLQGFGFVDFECDEFVCSTGFGVIHAKPDAYGKFIYHTLYSHETSKYFYACVVGSNYPALNNNDVEKLNIPTPSLPEQRKIAEILSAWDKAIDLVGKQIESKQWLKKGLMQQLLTGRVRFRDYVESTKLMQTKYAAIPADWTVNTVFELGKKNHDTVQTGPFGAQLHASDYVEEGIPLILIRNIEDNRLDPDNIPRITEKDAERLSKYALQENDIVFSRVGRVGSCFIAAKEHVGWIISGQTLRIRLPKNVINIDYLSYAIQDTSVKKYLMAVSIGSTRKSISTMILEKLPIISPSQDEQTSIAIVLKRCDAEIVGLKEKINILRKQKRGLMQKLLTGEVRMKVQGGKNVENTHS